MQVTGGGVASVVTARPGYMPGGLHTAVTCAGAACEVAVSCLSTAVAADQYTSTFAVQTLDAAGAVLQSKDVRVTYTVSPRLTLGGASTPATFTYGDTRTSQVLSLPVTAGGRSWSAASDVSWLQVAAGARSDAALAVTADASALAPGHHEGHVTVTGTADPLDTATVLLAADVAAPVLSVTPASLVLGGADGLSSDPQPLSIALSAGSAHAYTVQATTASGGTWLSAAPASGSVGSTSVLVPVSADRGVAAGTYTGSLRVSVAVRDLTLTKDVPVTYNREAHRLVAGATGVGFSSAPGRSVLSRSVPVLSSLGRTAVAWRASSDQPWLAATPSGATPQAVTLTADPAGLAAGTHFATVTVTSSDASIENVETIRVGLHVLSADPVAVAATLVATYAAASPVEPIVFLATGGPDVLGYDVYSGQQVRKHAGVVAAAGAMALSGDGQRLFVFDTTNQRVTEVDAVTGAFVKHYPAPSAGALTDAGTAVAYVRPAAFPVLLTPSSHAFDLVTGNEFTGSGVHGFSAKSLAPSPDQRYVVPDWGAVHALKRTALAGGGLTATAAFSVGSVQGRAGQACISADGAMGYTASGAPYAFLGTSMTTHQIVQTLPGAPFPNAIVCAWNGLVIGGADAYYDAFDVWVYDGPTGSELAKLSSATATSYRSLVQRGISVSADATRIVTLSTGMVQSGTGQVRFQSLPAPP